MKFAYMPDTHFGVYGQDPRSPDAAADAFGQIVEEAVLAEQTGFDGVFIPERHAQRRFAPDWLNFRLWTPDMGSGPAYPNRAETMAAIRRIGREVLPGVFRRENPAPA